ncbi:MAG TPA: hypothetical protein ENK18_24055 [Deltaproteobacteria bacterium]|nr:hypothetical protein [Deltaproteobacteria bacterium]
MIRSWPVGHDPSRLRGGCGGGSEQLLQPEEGRSEGTHQGDLVDLLIVEARGPQRVDVLIDDLVGTPRELIEVGLQGLGGLGGLGGPGDPGMIACGPRAGSPDRRLLIGPLGPAEHVRGHPDGRRGC